MLEAAHLGANIALPVGNLIKVVVALQLLPFAAGLALHRWTPEIAAAWRPFALRVSNLTFLGVFAFSLLGSWRQLIALLGSRTLLAAIVFTALSIVIGTVVARGSMETRTTMGLLAPTRNAGPVFAAVALGFANDPAILSAVSGILLIGLVIAVPTASYLARDRLVLETEPVAEQARSPL